MGGSTKRDAGEVILNWKCGEFGENSLSAIYLFREYYENLVMIGTFD